MIRFFSKNLMYLSSRYFIIVFSTVMLSYSVAAENLNCDSIGSNNKLSEIELKLSGHHFSESVFDSENQNDLVCSLLKLRLSSKHPKVQTRVEKILLSKFSNHSEVKDLIIQDVKDPEKLGLASVIMSNIDSLRTKDKKFFDQILLEAEKTVESLKTQKSGNQQNTIYIERISSLIQQVK